MTAWTEKHGLTHDSLGPTLHLSFSDFQSEADHAAFGKAALEYPDMLPEIVIGAIEAWSEDGGIQPGTLKPRAKAFAAKCAEAAAKAEPVSESNALNPRVVEAIDDYARWVEAGKPVDGIQ